MNEKLAVEILTRIKNGNQAYFDILSDIKKDNRYFNLKDTEFRDTIEELKEHDCISNLSGGHPKHYIVSPNKDCLSIYQKRVKEEQETIDKEIEAKWYETEMAKKKYIDYPKVKLRAEIATVVAVISLLANLVLIYLQLKGQ